MRRIDFVTLFPEQVSGFLAHSMMRRAQQAGIVSFTMTNPRDFATDNHRTVDDAPYGGGPGMLMKAEPVAQAIEAKHMPGALIVWTDPTGRPFRQDDARELSLAQQVIFVCGHYEGIDHRAREEFATHVFSVGDFVLTNGELPALMMADAVVRLLPGVLGSAESLEIDSHGDGLLSAPQFTKPQNWRGREVPEVLLSGNHQEIAKWRRRQALMLTREARPDLFARAKVEISDVESLGSGS